MSPAFSCACGHPDMARRPREAERPDLLMAQRTVRASP